MLKINVVAVGSIKEKYFVEAIEEYSKRLSRFCTLKIIEVPEQTMLSGDKKTEAETASLLQKARGFIVLLDRRGAEVSSEQLSNIIEGAKTQGEGEMSFVIGGSNGVAAQLLSAANKTISFGKITFPHQLFRIVLLEQIYRAFTISGGLPYHK